MSTRQTTVAVVHLVSCVSRKRSIRSPARNLYVSDWFVKARAFVESRGGPWYILSAEHGLVAPNRLISPYERTLNTMKVGERRAWAKMVTAQLDAEGVQAERIVVLAGRRYREFLMPALSSMATSVEVPMEGLGIGEQLAWLKERR
jgi:hypothetical protein